MPAFDKTLEPMEIRPQRTAEYWNERKFVVSIRQGTRTSGNSFTTFDRTLEPTEICSQQTTERWNERKFVVSVRQDTRTGGNSFTTFDRTLELAEIVAARCAAYRVFFENSQMFGAACRNERKLSQCDALLTSQGVALLTEFSYGKVARGVGKAQKIAVIICFINNRRRGRWEKIE